MFEFFVAVILIAVCWFLYQSRVSSHMPLRKNPIPQNVYEWSEHADEFDIVGELHYQPAIKLLAGANDEHVRSKEYRAFLIPENDNPYDDKAIRVDIEGMVVGYLSREDARNFRRRLGAKKLVNQITACNAHVTGGRTRNGQKCVYGICLNIKEFGW